MPILQFVYNSSFQIFTLPLNLWIIDLVVVTTLRVAFGSTLGLFRPRFKTLPRDFVDSANSRLSESDYDRRVDEAKSRTFGTTSLSDLINNA